MSSSILGASLQMHSPIRLFRLAFIILTILHVCCPDRFYSSFRNVRCFRNDNSSCTQVPHKITFFPRPVTLRIFSNANLLHVCKTHRKCYLFPVCEQTWQIVLDYRSTMPKRPFRITLDVLAINFHWTAEIQIKLTKVWCTKFFFCVHSLWGVHWGRSFIWLPKVHALRVINE